MIANRLKYPLFVISLFSSLPMFCLGQQPDPYAQLTVAAGAPNAPVPAVPKPVPITAPEEPLGNQPPQTPEDIFANAVKAVVKITSGKGGIGSGFVVTKDGYIVTNQHVTSEIAQDGKVDVYFYDQTEQGIVEVDRMEGKVVGEDSQRDIAVVKVDGSDQRPFLKLGNSSSHKIGNTVFTLGTGLRQADGFAQGIISGSNRDIVNGTYIQTTALINPGNSGGPLIDVYGRVIGINSRAEHEPQQDKDLEAKMRYGSQGVGFAIPIDRVKPIINDLIAKAKLPFGTIGIQEFGSFNIAGQCALQNCGYPGKFGALVDRLDDEGPAYKAGIRVGDVIYKINGIMVTSNDDVNHTVRDISAGQAVTLEVFGGESFKKRFGDDQPMRTFTITVRQGTPPPPAKEAAK